MSNHQTNIIGAATPALRQVTARVALKPIWAAIVGLTTLNFAAMVSPAHAVSVTYNFTVRIDSDAYETQALTKGTTEEGSFTYDDSVLTETGSEYVSPSVGDLTLSFNFLNSIYTEKSDLNYGSTLYKPDYPAALFTDGKLSGLDFLVVPSQLQPPRNALGFRVYKDMFYVGTTGSTPDKSGTLVGRVTYSNAGSLPEPPPPGAGVAAVPEPSEVGGAIVASLLGIWALKKVKGRRKG